MAEPSGFMMDAFGFGVGSSLIECVCGRTHCCPNSRYLEEGEEASFRASAAKHPTKYVLYEGYDSVSAKQINGQTVVPDCECGFMVKLENLLWAERASILRYFKARRESDERELRDLAAASGSQADARCDGGDHG